MIITDKFVYIHEPKTGGTFVTSALLRLHEVRWTRWTQVLTMVRRDVSWRTRFGPFIYHNNKHGTCNDAPARYRDRPFLSTIRHPLDLYVSEYEFGWWKRKDMTSLYQRVPDFAALFPAFPDLSFAEYVELANLAFRARPDLDWRGQGPGPMTERFVRYYCKDPGAVMDRLRDAPDDADVVRRDMHPVTFLRTKGVNAQLHDYLASVGYPADALAFILSMGRVLPHGKGRSAAQAWEGYYTPALLDVVRRRESLLFALVPAFDQ